MLYKLFSPESVLIFGVSRSKENLARNIVKNLIYHDFIGKFYLYGRKKENLFGHEILTSPEEIPDNIDLAVFLMPASVVPEYLEICGQKGIKFAVIETGGFSEYGEEKAYLENKLKSIAEKYGIRFVGPNCLGIINFENSLFVPFMSMEGRFRKGKIGVFAQSGGVGSVYLQMFVRNNLGLNKFVSLGNKLNIDECDLLEFLMEEKNTDLAVYYLEDLKDGKRFFNLLKKCDFPVIIQKANRTSASEKIAKTHTASMSVDDVIFDSMCKQANVLRVYNMKSAVSTATALTLPPVKGNRLGIISRSGGHAVIAADYADEYGFVLPDLPDSLKKKAENFFRAKVIKPINPLDLGDLFNFEIYVAITEEMINSGLYDGIVFVHTFSETTEFDETLKLAKKLDEIVKKSGIPVATSFFSTAGAIERIKRSTTFPIFDTPEEAISALARAKNYYDKKEKLKNAFYPQLVDRKTLTSIRNFIKSLKNTQPDILETFKILELAGINVAPYTFVPFEKELSPDKLADFLNNSNITYPVALKVISNAISHKTEVGGVVLNIKNREGLISEILKMKNTFSENGFEIKGFLVQKMFGGLREVLVGAHRDKLFGGVVTTGFGGIYTELFKDISSRVVPVSDLDVKEMLDEVYSFRALHAFRGLPEFDIEFLQNTIFKISNIMEKIEEIHEIEINPMKIYRKGQGGVVLDARMTVSI